MPSPRKPSGPIDPGDRLRGPEDRQAIVEPRADRLPRDRHPDRMDDVADLDGDIKINMFVAIPEWLKDSAPSR